MTQAVGLHSQLSKPSKGTLILLFLCQIPSFWFHNFRILIAGTPRSWLFCQSFFFSFLCFPYHCYLVIHSAIWQSLSFDSLQVKGQCFQLLGLRSKYLLKQSRDLKPYLVPVSIHLAWLSFCLLDKRMTKGTHLPFTNQSILEPCHFLEHSLIRLFG
jgi:hypothetical protein